MPAADGKRLAEGQLAPAGQEVERSTLRENTLCEHWVAQSVSMTAASLLEVRWGDF